MTQKISEEIKQNRVEITRDGCAHKIVSHIVLANGAVSLFVNNEITYVGLKHYLVGSSAVAVD